jgi:hypothetical protein
MGNAQRLSPPGARAGQARSEAWAPWASLALGLLLAGGVTGVVLNRRQRRQRQMEADGPPPGA